MKSKANYFTNEFRNFLFATETDDSKCTDDDFLNGVYSTLNNYCESQGTENEKETLNHLFPTQNNFGTKKKQLLRRILGNTRALAYIPKLRPEEVSLFANAYKKNISEITTSKKLSWKKPLGQKIQKKESITINKKTSSPYITGLGQLETHVVTIIHAAKFEISIFLSDKEMSSFLEYTLALITSMHNNRDITISLYYFQTYYGDERDYKRQRMLKYLGINLYHRLCDRNEVPPFIGLIVDANSKEPLLLSLNPIEENETNYLYLSANFRFLIQSAYKNLKSLNFNYVEIHKKKNIPDVRVISVDDYKKILTKAGVYKNFSKALDRIKFREYPLEEIGSFYTFQHHGIKNYKLLQLDRFLMTLNLSKDQIWAIRYLNNLYHVINPPIVEKVDKKYYIIEGHTRFYVALQKFYKKESDKIFAIEVDMGFSDEHENFEPSLLSMLKPNEHYPVEYNKGLKRYIEKITHSEQFDSEQWKELFPFNYEKENVTTRKKRDTSNIRRKKRS